MKQAKGFFGRRKNVWTVAKNAVEKAMVYAYRDREARIRIISARRAAPQERTLYNQKARP